MTAPTTAPAPEAPILCAQTGQPMTDAQGVVILPVAIFRENGMRVYVHGGQPALDYAAAHPDAVKENPLVPTHVQDQIAMADRVQHLVGDNAHLQLLEADAAKKFAVAQSALDVATVTMGVQAQTLQAQKAEITELRNVLEGLRAQPPAVDPEALLMFQWIEFSDFTVVQWYLSPAAQAEFHGFRGAVRQGMDDHPLTTG